MDMHLLTSSSFTLNCAEHLRLVDGSNSGEGRVEVMEGNQWKTVCENTWSYRSAQIVCSMLGYPGYVAHYNFVHAQAVP